MAKLEKLITFEKGMTASPYSDVNPDGELELLNNLEVHAGSIKPAAFMGTAEGVEYNFAKERFTLRFAHTTGSIKHLFLSQNDTGDVYYYDVKSGGTPIRIKGLVWNDESMEAVSLGNLVVISSSELDDRYLLWRHGEYKFTLGTVEDDELKIEDSEDVKIKDIRLRFGMQSSQTQFVDLGHGEISTEHYAMREVFVCCAPSQEDSAVIGAHLAGLMGELREKCESLNQMILPFFARYVVRNKADQVVKVSPPVLITPTSGCPLLVVDFKNTNDNWSAPAEYGEKFHYGVVGTCVDVNSPNAIDTISNLAVSVIGNRDVVLDDVINSIEVYVTPPLTMYDYQKGYMLMNVPYKYDSSMPLAYVNGITSGYIRKPWIEDGVRHDRINGATIDTLESSVATPYSNKVVISQRGEWLMKLAQLMAYNPDPARCKKYPFDITRDYIAIPSALAGDKLDDEVEGVLSGSKVQSGFKLYKRYEFNEGKTLKEVIEGEHHGNITNPISNYFSIGASQSTIDGEPAENDKTTGGHLFRYNSRLFKFGYQRTSGIANYTGDELQQASGARVLIDAEVSSLSSEGWGMTHENPISENSGGTPMFVLPTEGSIPGGEGLTLFADAARVKVQIKNISAATGLIFGFVYYKDSEGKTYVGSVPRGELEDSAQAYGLHGMPFSFFSYPKHGCFKAVIFQKDIDGEKTTWRRITIPMKSVETMGEFSYWSMYDQSVTEVIVLDGEPTEDAMPEVSTEEVRDLNRVAVSEAYNPYDVGFKSPEVTVGTGEVLALAVQKAAISTGQFGTHPIIAFCTDGNYALTINELGEIGNVDPMEGPLLISKNSLVTTHRGVYYASKNGLCLLSGNQHRILSKALEGKAPSNIVEVRRVRPNIVIQTQEMDARNMRDDSLVLEGEELAEYALKNSITLQDASVDDIMKCIPHFVPTNGEKVSFWVMGVDEEGEGILVDDNSFSEVLAGSWIYCETGDGPNDRYVVCEGIEKAGSPGYYFAPDYVSDELGYTPGTSVTGKLMLDELIYRRRIGGLIHNSDIKGPAVTEEDRQRGIIIDQEFDDTYIVAGIDMDDNPNASWSPQLKQTIKGSPIRLHWNEDETERVLRVAMTTHQPSGVKNGRIIYKEVTFQECAITLTKDSESSKVVISRVAVRVANWNKMQMPTCCVIEGYKYKLSCDILDIVSRLDADAKITIYNKEGDELYSGDPSRLDVKSDNYDPITFVAAKTDPLYYLDYKIEGVTLTTFDRAVVTFTLETTIGEYQLESRYGLVQSRNEVLDTRSVVFSKGESIFKLWATLHTPLIGSVYTLSIDNEVLASMPGTTAVVVTDGAGNEITTTIADLCANGCDIVTEDDGDTAPAGRETVLAILAFPDEIEPLAGEEVIEVPYTVTLKTIGGQNWTPPYGQNDDPDIAAEEQAEIAAEREHVRTGVLSVRPSIWSKPSGMPMKKNEVFDVVVEASSPVTLMVGSNSITIPEAGYHKLSGVVANASWEDARVRVCPVAIELSEKTMIDGERSQRATELTGDDIPDNFFCAVTLTNFKSVWTETSYMKILSNPLVHAVYDEMGQRIFYGVPGARTFVVFNIETETFSMMTSDYPLRAVINEHPYTYIQFEDYSLLRLDGRMDYIDEKEGGYDGYIVSRPFKMDSMDLKKISEISLVGNFRESQELTIQGSNSIQGLNGDNWVTLGTTQRHRVPHIVGRWFKYWRVIMRTHLHETEDITGIRVKFEVRRDGRLR